MILSNKIPATRLKRKSLAFHAVKDGTHYSVDDTIFFVSLLGRAFKMMNNGIYFIAIAFLVAKLFKIVIYASSRTSASQAGHE